MKQCPLCKSSYTDNSLAFCLNDGTKLAALNNNSEATVQMSGQTNPMRITVPNSEPTFPKIPANQSTETKERRSYGLLIGILVIGGLAIIAIAGAAGAYFVFGNKDEAAKSPATPAPTAVPDNKNAFDKADAQTRELEEKLNKLEKQLEAQKKSGTAPALPNSDQTQSALTARVNSPNDGFLALRSAPGTETGAQLLKIPHGATVRLRNCEKNTTRVGGRSGRWCQVEYAEKTGWVFSAWLNY